MRIKVSALTFEGLLSVLGCTGALFGTTASFCQKDKLLLQLMFTGASSIWLIHNYIAGSPRVVLMEFVFLSSNVVGYFSYYMRPYKQAMTKRLSSHLMYANK